MEEKKNRKISLFIKLLAGEFVFLLVALFVCRLWLFPLIAGIEMYHVRIATHAMMLGILFTLVTIMLLIALKKWKTHKKYISLPLLFTVFGFFLLKIAEEISLF